MSSVERETKLLVTPRDHARLLEGGRVRECREQLNVYYHDPERLGEGRGYFRVRFESGRAATATLKLPVGWTGGIREMLEVERPLRALGPPLHPRPPREIDVAETLPPPFGDPLLAMGIARIRRLGWMRNRRCVVELLPGESVEVDRTRLPGGEVLHEVEIESPDDVVHTRLTARVRELAPSAELSRVGKFPRFLAAVGLYPLV